MKLSQIKETLILDCVYECQEDFDFLHVFASDLMSDALAMIDDGETTLFLTGLVNMQSLRTAEMLDIHTILFVRHKTPDEAMIETAKELGLNLYVTSMTMYEACGLLYKGGMKP